MSWNLIQIFVLINYTFVLSFSFLAQNTDIKKYFQIPKIGWKPTSLEKNFRVQILYFKILNHLSLKETMCFQHFWNNLNGIKLSGRAENFSLRMTQWKAWMIFWEIPVEGLGVQVPYLGYRCVRWGVIICAKTRWNDTRARHWTLDMVHLGAGVEEHGITATRCWLPQGQSHFYFTHNSIR